ncbi:hypothetical protein E2986_12220 [Frieseomelitta varia]|uniref:Uncharacterized protein n=1 Tax=Frieseomelitta varia TaxID=561572 RepID=A0A833RU47_9HYME|nr:hypothetical protein E2986_12220 [Frieseomelitta varia]
MNRRDATRRYKRPMLPCSLHRTIKQNPHVSNANSRAVALGRAVCTDVNRSSCIIIRGARVLGPRRRSGRAVTRSEAESHATPDLATTNPDPDLSPRRDDDDDDDDDDAGNRPDSPCPRRNRPHCNRDRERNSYRSWLERIRKERPPFLTIVSLELPDSPIPLIESQASARSSRIVVSKDDVLDEPSDEIATEAESEGRRKRSWRKPRRRRGKEFLECTKGAPTLEECTKNIVEGPSLGARLSSLDLQDVTKCICAETSGNARVDIGSAEAEAGRESRSSSPEMAHHTIRIAMRQHYEDHASCWIDDDDDDDDDDGEETEGNGRSRPETTSLRRNARPRKEIAKEEEASRNDGVNDALDFTLNCSGVRLTCRDTSLRTGTLR